jgi:hypothetical protein
MKELKIVWGRKATEQKKVMVESSASSIQELVDRAIRYMSSLQSPLYYDTPDGWFTKTTWNKWGEGVELTARVDLSWKFAKGPSLISLQVSAWADEGYRRSLPFREPLDGCLK